MSVSDFTMDQKTYPMMAELRHAPSETKQTEKIWMRMNEYRPIQ
jgi:hypothetical protein